MFSFEESGFDLEEQIGSKSLKLYQFLLGEILYTWGKKFHILNTRVRFAITFYYSTWKAAGIMPWTTKSNHSASFQAEAFEKPEPLQKRKESHQVSWMFSLFTLLSVQTGVFF